MVRIEPPPAFSMSGSAAGGRNERVGGDVERKPEAVARRVREPALEVARVGEGDRVDREIELAAEGLCHLGEGLLEPFVGADVALADEWAPDRLCQVAHPFFDPLALVGERQLRAAGREPCAIAQAIERRLATPGRGRACRRRIRARGRSLFACLERGFCSLGT